MAANTAGNEEIKYFINLICFTHRNHDLDYRHSEQCFKSSLLIKSNELLIH